MAAIKRGLPESPCRHMAAIKKGLPESLCRHMAAIKRGLPESPWQTPHSCPGRFVQAGETYAG